MANLSELSRKEQVEKVLRDHLGMWVDGTALANEDVGGSEGLKRLRELRSDLLQAGSEYMIQQRKHPGVGRAIYQYRMVKQTTAFTENGQPAWAPPRQEATVARPNPRPAPPRSDPSAQSAQGSWMDPQQRIPRDTNTYDWKPAKKARGTLEYIFWIGKQRIIAAVGPLGDGRWGWGVLVPANKSRMTPERRAGHGVSPDKESAQFACEERVREMRTSGEYR